MENVWLICFLTLRLTFMLYINIRILHCISQKKVKPIRLKTFFNKLPSQNDFFCHIIDVKVCFQEVDSFAILNYHLANRLNSKLIHRPILRLVFKLNTIFFLFPVVGEWSEWLTFSKCQRGIFGDCYMSMLRQCTSAGSGLSVNAHCHGQSLKRTRCAC